MKLIGPHKINLKKSPRHIIIKLSEKTKRVLKAAREKKLVTYKRTPMKLTVNFLPETLQAKKVG